MLKVEKQKLKAVFSALNRVYISVTHTSPGVSCPFSPFPYQFIWLFTRPHLRRVATSGWESGHNPIKHQHQAGPQTKENPTDHRWKD